MMNKLTVLSVATENNFFFFHLDFWQLFFSFFQSLVDKNVQVTLELKNDVQISGTLQSIDQFLNLRITNVSFNDPERYPHLVRVCIALVSSRVSPIFLQLSIRNCVVRGSVIRYIHLNASDVDTDLLQDFCRKEASQNKQLGSEQKGKQKA